MSDHPPPPHMAHDKITTQNGAIVKIEWEAYVGGGGYALWSLEEHGEGCRVTRCYDGNPVETWEWHHAELREMAFALATLMGRKLELPIPNAREART